MKQFNENNDKFPVDAYIFDDVTRKYRDLSSLDIVKEYTLDSSKVGEVLNSWKDLLESRYNAMLMEDKPENNNLLLMIIQNNDVANVIYKDMDLMNLYNDITSRYKALNICILYTNYDNATVSYDAPEPIRMIKMDRHIICFDDLDNLKVFDVNYEDLRANKKKLQIGDAYYINDNTVVKLKMVKNI